MNQIKQSNPQSYPAFNPETAPTVETPAISLEMARLVLENQTVKTLVRPPSLRSRFLRVSQTRFIL